MKWTTGKGHLKLLVQQKKQDEYIIQQDIRANCGSKRSRIVNKDVLLEFMEDNWNCYELLTNNSRRLYFDCDNTTTYNDVIDIIKATFTDALLHISGYETAEKKSYHIIISNIHLQDEYDRKLIKMWIDKQPAGMFDKKVYDNQRAFKLPNQSKKGSNNIQKIITENSKLEDFIINVEEGGNSIKNYISFTEEELKDHQKNISPMDISNLVGINRLGHNTVRELQDTDVYTDLTNLEILQPIPPTIITGEQRFYLSVWSNEVGISLQDYITWITPRLNSPRSSGIERYIQDYHNSKYYICYTKKIEPMLKTLYPNIHLKTHLRKWIVHDTFSIYDIF
ncbi:MAG: hypothetical protein WD512_19825, partial [Candidatus Paceibacterota bacterium]